MSDGKVRVGGRIPMEEWSGLTKADKQLYRVIQRLRQSIEVEFGVSKKGHSFININQKFSVVYIREARKFVTYFRLKGENFNRSITHNTYEEIADYLNRQDYTQGINSENVR